MKKIILFLILFIISFNVYGKDTDLEEYNKAFIRLNESYDKFIGACSNEERLAIIDYAHGDIDKLSGGYDTFKSISYKDVKEINDYCASYAEDLYDAIKYGEGIANNYKMIGLKLTSDIEIKKNVLVVGSKITSREDLTVIDDCDLIGDDVMDVFYEVLKYFQIACVSLCIILCIVDLYKLLVSKEIDNKKAFKNIKLRIIVLVIILLIPTITNIIVSIINRYTNVDALKCLES